MKRAAGLACVVVTGFVAMLLTAAPSQAVTIGTALNAPPATAEGCEIVVLPPLRQTVGVPGSCTFFAPNSQTPPGNYVVTTGRIRTGPRTGPMKFTAVEALRSKATVNGRPGGIICCTATTESQTFVPPANSVVQVPMRLPMRNTTILIDGEQVEVINYLGITLLNLQSSAPLAASQTPMTSFFAPALRAGGQLLMNGFNGSVVPLINGEFAPCATAGRASISQVGCPGGSGPATSFAVARRTPLLGGGRAARVIVRTPGAGALGVRPVARFRRLLLPAVQAVRGGVSRVTSRLSRPGLRLLRRRGQIRVPVIVTFRPRGGSPTSKRSAIVFRRGG